MAKKPSTDEIMKLLRQKDGAAAASPNADTVPETAAQKPQPVSELPKDAAPSAPKSTADILAAARKQTAPTPAAKPKGTADILAALRAEKTGAAKATSEEVPAKTTDTSKSDAKQSPVANVSQMSVKDMVEELKSGTKPSSSTAITTEKTPLRVPVKPDKPSMPVNQQRRSLLLLGLNGLIACVSTPFAAAWTMMAAMAATWTLAIARFMFPNVLVEPPTRFKIGPASDYPPGAVSTKWTAARGIWVVHTDQYKGADSIYALASVCTHLGCTPNWLDSEQKFKCPCHGSGFYITGINFEGPAPRPLERVGLRLAADGALEVDKSVKFQEEKGQWEDGKSFVDASLV